MIKMIKYSMPSCGSCKILKPTWNKIVTENPDIEALEIELNRNNQVQHLKIDKVPAIEFFKDGKSEKILTGKSLCYAVLTQEIQLLKHDKPEQI